MTPSKPENSEIGNRLRKFAQKFGGTSALARALGVSPNQITNYLSGRRIPGNKMQERLRKVGCDTLWLMTGKGKEQVIREPEQGGHKIPKGFQPTEEEISIILSLRRLGIHDTSSLMLSLDESVVGDRIIGERKLAIEASRKKTSGDNGAEEGRKRRRQ